MTDAIRRMIRRFAIWKASLSAMPILYAGQYSRI